MLLDLCQFHINPCSSVLPNVLSQKQTRGPICMNIWRVICSLSVSSTGKKRDRSIRLFSFTKASVSYGNSVFFHGKFVNPLSMLGTERAPWHSCSNSVRSFSSHTWQPAYMAYLAFPWAVVVRNHSSPSQGEQHQTKYIRETHFLDNRIGWPLSYFLASIWDWLQTCINYYSMWILTFKKGKWKLRFPERLNRLNFWAHDFA